MTINFLKETINVLNEHNKTPKDIKWIGDFVYKIDWENFEKFADFEYDNGYGGIEILRSLKIVGEDFWLERAEYDGSEWWEYKTFPAEPELELPENKKVSNWLTYDWGW